MGSMRCVKEPAGNAVRLKNRGFRSTVGAWSDGAWSAELLLLVLPALPLRLEVLLALCFFDLARLFFWCLRGRESRFSACEAVEAGGAVAEPFIANCAFFVVRKLDEKGCVEWNLSYSINGQWMIWIQKKRKVVCTVWGGCLLQYAVHQSPALLQISNIPKNMVSSCDIFKCEFAGGVELHTWGAMFIGYRAVILQSFLRQVNINTLFGARVFPTVASKCGFQKVGFGADEPLRHQIY
jgi:hypothetical protein